MSTCQKKRVYTDGIFDLYHYGHIRSFEKIREHFEEPIHLIVGIIGDQQATNYKRKPVYPEKHRYALVNSCRSVDEVIEDSPLILTHEFLKKHNIQAVTHGFTNPQDAETQDEFFRVPRQLGIFHTTAYEPGISTSQILKTLQEN